MLFSMGSRGVQRPFLHPFSVSVSSVLYTHANFGSTGILCMLFIISLPSSATFSGYSQPGAHCTT